MEDFVDDDAELEDGGGTLLVGQQGGGGWNRDVGGDLLPDM